ncbi:peptide transporter [Metallosphaera tengchongensis]|uniref:dolichyl-phosphooligosaccharide-protein glycotransferase n=1 Tax=Metallosphaera tengchongensis TaxID=1532350 RepID=A0A6N0NWF1_9CREN|nr:STT3 domain-containing protein [Metallosphaera tengchongensis]QKQ99440.1 peptide transporter [Metallosphaera tengchongensis]
MALKEVSNALRKTVVVDLVSVLGISLVSMVIRALSAAYPLSINGFDSWYLFYNALLIAQAHGNWYAVPPDVHSWFPSGFFIELGDTIGLPFISALLALPFYSTYGPNAVYTVVLFLDLALAGLGVVATYLAVEGLTKSKVGAIVASLIIAVSPALTYKNLIGGLPKTSWGGVFVLFSIYLLNLAIERKKPWYGALASVPLFLAEVSWGGYTYIDISLLAAAFLLILLNRNDEVTAKSFTLMGVFTGFLTSFAPNNIGFLSGAAHGLSMVLISLLLFLDIYLKKVIPKERVMSKSLILSSLILFIFVLAMDGLSVLGKTPIPSRYYAIVDPFFQFTVPIDRTVAEYIPQSITSMLVDFGVAIFLSIIGMYYFIKEGNLAGMWLLVLGVASIYGTSEQPYLFNYTAYMVAPLAGAGVYYVVSRLRQSNVRVAPILLLVVVGVSLVADAGSAIVASNTPNAIITSASPYPIPNYAWVTTLDWLRYDTPSHAFVLSWWDYGYWIEVLGNKTVIDENNTLNGTQIRLMAEIFLNNETYAAYVLEHDFHVYPYGSQNYTIPTYIVAYDAVTVYRGEGFLGYPTNLGGQFLGYTSSLGDIGKAMGAMTVIAGYPVQDYVNITLLNQTETQIATEFQSNPTLAQQLVGLVSNSFPFAWTHRAYQSLIVNMFVEGLQVQGYPVVAPFSGGITSTGVNLGSPLPQVRMEYFQPVQISMAPLYGNGQYEVYVMVVVYQFVQPGTVIQVS